MAPDRRTQLPPRRLRWLSEQVDAWRDAGVIGDEQATAIRDRYEPDTRTSLAKLAFGLGAVFLSVGVLWLVASQLDYESVSPLRRFGAVAALWLAATAGGVLSERFGAPLRLLAALLFGGVVFQAAQSLQVPAYEPSLLLAWAGGALALAYGARSVGPLLVGLTAGVGWYVWALAEHAEDFPAYVLGFGLATPVLAAAATVHRDQRMSAPWLRVATVAGLASLWLASLPGELGREDLAMGKRVYAGIAVAILAAVVAAWRAGRRALPELAFGGGVAGACLLLALLAPHTSIDLFRADEASGGVLLHALVASAAYLAASVGVAALGVARELPSLVNVAAIALVGFVTMQSFSLFAPLLSGSLLFLLVGGLLVGTGLLVDRGRRRLHEEIAA